MGNRPLLWNRDTISPRKIFNHVQRRRKEKEEFTPIHTDFELGECDDCVNVLEDGTRYTGVVYGKRWGGVS